jgi:hypothetical protein
METGTWFMDFRNAGAAGRVKRKESGHVVRGRVLDPRTGKKRELWKVLPDASATEAKTWLEGACERVRQGVVEQVLARERLRDSSCVCSTAK